MTRSSILTIPTYRHRVFMLMNRQEMRKKKFILDPENSFKKVLLCVLLSCYAVLCVCETINLKPLCRGVIRKYIEELMLNEGR